MEIGTSVRVINEGGDICAIGTYQGSGIPSKNLNATYPNIQHYAIFVNGEMRYYPVGFHTLLRNPVSG